MAEAGTVRGRVARFTRLDQFGRPVYGEAGTAVTKGIIEISFTPNVTEGDAVSVQNFAGEQCITSPAPCPTIDNWSISIQFCAVDPCIVLMIYPSWIPYFDDFGNIKGFQVVGDLSCDVGFALEVWANAATGQAASSTCGPTATGQFRYFLLPRLVGAAPGDITISNDATTFTFNGTTTTPVGWRRGPYLVDVVGGMPSPLRDPMGSTTQLLDITTQVRPPEPTGGCIELPRPVPEEADITITCDPQGDSMCARLISDNHGFGPVIVTWGDGTDPETYPDCAVITHCYETPGDYEICVADQQTPAVRTCRTVQIPCPGDNPILSVEADPSDPMCVIATVDMPPHSDGRVTLHWGDDTSEEITVTPGTPAEVSHCYQSAGVYQIRAVRTEMPEFSTTATVIVPTSMPPTVQTTINDMEVCLTIDNHGNGLTSVDWGDGSTGTGPASDGGTVCHTYGIAGEYDIVVESFANPLARTTTTVVVGDVSGTLRAHVEADDSDNTGQTAQVTWESKEA